MPRLFASLLLLLCPLLVQADEVIRVYNWNDYIAPEVLGDFERDTGFASSTTPSPRPRS